MKIDQKDWAIEKVRKLSPASPQKVTLLAIARFSETNGEGCWAKIETLAEFIGKSVRTVQSHISKLVERGELRVEYQAKKPYRTNMYFISVCRLTAAEREQIPRYSANDTKHENPIYIARNQMKLPLPQQQETSETFVRSPEVEKLFQDTLAKLERKQKKPPVIGNNLGEAEFETAVEISGQMLDITKSISERMKI